MSNMNRHMSMEELLRFADGELSLVEVTRVKHHLAACWDCRAKLHQAENTIGEVMDLHHQALDPQVPPIAGSRALLKARLIEAEGRDQHRSWLRTSIWPQVALAGTLTALVLAGILVIDHHVRSGAGDSRLSVFASYAEPNRQLTPGAARLVGTDELCANEYSDDARMVPAAMREKVLEEYGVADRTTKDYELDYLISPQLGGTEDISNLWPQPAASTEWNIRAKDALENRLHQLVCRGNVSLATAQRDLATDWISAYKKYFHTTQPVRPL
jgi:hypothetical protein